MICQHFLCPRWLLTNLFKQARWRILKPRYIHGFFFLNWTISLFGFHPFELLASILTQEALPHVFENLKQENLKLKVDLTINIGDNLIVKFSSYISGKNKPTLAELCTLKEMLYEIYQRFLERNSRCFRYNCRNFRRNGDEILI